MPPTDYCPRCQRLLSTCECLPGGGFARMVEAAGEAAAKVPPSMVLSIHQDQGIVKVYLDNKVDTYSEWIKGEGGDCGLMREMGTDRVVGFTLPIRQSRVIVWGASEVEVVPDNSSHPENQ